MPYTKQNTRVRQFTVCTEFDAADAATLVHCTALLEARVTNDADPADVLLRPSPQVVFNLLDPAVASANFTAAGKTVSGLQLAALIRQACLSMANAQGIS